MAHKRGRPPTPLDREASCAARLGAELRDCRDEATLTQQKLADLIDYTPQHISEVERAKATAARAFIAACDEALDAQGRLLELLPAALDEREQARQARAKARRAARQAEAATALPCAATHSEAGDDADVQPTDRRGLLEAGAAAALGVPLLGSDAVPARAGEVDPELPGHWDDLLRLLGRHDDSFGPRAVLACVEREIRLIAGHRKVARGELRVALMRVESRWAELAAWLSEDSGRRRARDAWTTRALHLATEADYADMRAFTRARQGEFASDGRRAAALAEDALSLPGMSPQTRAWCSRQAATGHAMAGDAASCERHLAVAYGLLDDDSTPPPYANGYRVDHIGTRAAEAACWLELAPAKAIVLYDEALRAWPRSEARDGGIHTARLALACARTGELDRARSEGRTAFAIAQTTKSVTAERELRRLAQALKAA